MPHEVALRPARSTTIESYLPVSDLVSLEQELVDSLAAAQRRYASNPHLEPSYRRLAEFVLQGGKRLRPRLALAAYRILSGEEPTRAAIQVAASLELFHAFMLIHDDLIDLSPARRGRPTLHEAIRQDQDDPGDTKSPADLALLGGDLLFALGMRVIARAGLAGDCLARVQRFVSDMLFETGVGEALDVLYGTSPLDQISEGQIIEAYLRKTSRYSVSGPLILGAILAGASPAKCRALGRLGDHLGLAYQIHNDLDELAGDPDDPCPDLDTGKRTYVLWQAHQGLDRAGRVALARALEAPVGRARRARLLELFQQAGALEACRVRLERVREDAAAALAVAPFRAEQRQALALLTLWIGGTNAPRIPQRAATPSLP